MFWYFVPFLMTLGMTQAVEEAVVQLNIKRWQQQVSERFLSVSLDPAALLQGKDLKWSSTRTLTLAKALSPAYLRLAGDGSNYFLFQDKKDNNSMSDNDWILLNTFCQVTGLRLVAALNGMVRKDGSWDPRNSLTLIAFSDQMGFDLDWQLGYELQRIPVPVGGTQWGRDVLALRHILDAFPRYAHSAVLAPDITYFRTKEDIDFLRSFFDIAGPAVTAITWHPNFVEPSSTSDHSSEDSAESDALEAQPDTLSLDSEVLGRTLFRISQRKPLWIAESHTESSRGQDSFAGALQWAQRLGEAARLGIQVLLRQPDVRGLMQPSPDYWVSLLHKRLVGREVFDVRLTFGNRTHISVFCHCTKGVPGAITLFGANILHHKARIAVKGSSLGPGDMMSMDQYTLTEDKGLTLLNGAPLELSPDEELPVLTPRVRHVPRSLTLSMPAQSIVFWVLPEARVRACNGAPNNPIFKIRSKLGNLLQDDSFELDSEVEFRDFPDVGSSQGIEKYYGKSSIPKLNNIKEKNNVMDRDIGNSKDFNLKFKQSLNANKEHLLKLNLDNLFDDEEYNRTTKYLQDSLEENIIQAIRLLQRGVQKHSALKSDKNKYYEEKLRESGSEAWFSRENSFESTSPGEGNSVAQWNTGVASTINEAGRQSNTENNSDNSLKLQVRPLIKEEGLVLNADEEREKYLQSMFASFLNDDDEEEEEDSGETTEAYERSKRAAGMMPKGTPVLADPRWGQWKKKIRLTPTKVQEADEDEHSDHFPEGDIYLSEVGETDPRRSDYVYLDDDAEVFMDHDDVDNDDDDNEYDEYYSDDPRSARFFDSEFFANVDLSTPASDNHFDGDEELWEIEDFHNAPQKHTSFLPGRNGYRGIITKKDSALQNQPDIILQADTFDRHPDLTRKRKTEEGHSRLNGQLYSNMEMRMPQYAEMIEPQLETAKQMNNSKANNNRYVIDPSNISYDNNKQTEGNRAESGKVYNSGTRRWYGSNTQPYPPHAYRMSSYPQAHQSPQRYLVNDEQARRMMLQNKQYLNQFNPRRVVRDVQAEEEIMETTDKKDQENIKESEENDPIQLDRERNATHNSKEASRLELNDAIALDDEGIETNRSGRATNSAEDVPETKDKSTDEVENKPESQTVLKLTKATEDEVKETDTKVTETQNEQTDDKKNITVEATTNLAEVDETKVPDPREVRRLALQRRRQERLETLRNLLSSRKRKREEQENGKLVGERHARSAPTLKSNSFDERIPMNEDHHYNGKSLINKGSFLPTMPLDHECCPNDAKPLVRTHLGDMAAETESKSRFSSIPNFNSENKGRFLTNGLPIPISVDLLFQPQAAEDVLITNYEIQKQQPVETISSIQNKHWINDSKGLKFLKEYFQRYDYPSWDFKQIHPYGLLNRKELSPVMLQDQEHQTFPSQTDKETKHEENMSDKQVMQSLPSTETDENPKSISKQETNERQGKDIRNIRSRRSLEDVIEEIGSFMSDSNNDLSISNKYSDIFSPEGKKKQAKLPKYDTDSTQIHILLDNPTTRTLNSTQAKFIDSAENDILDDMDMKELKHKFYSRKKKTPFIEPIQNNTDEQNISKEKATIITKSNKEVMTPFKDKDEFFFDDNSGNHQTETEGSSEEEVQETANEVNQTWKFNKDTQRNMSQKSSQVDTTKKNRKGTSFLQTVLSRLESIFSTLRYFASSAFGRN